MCNQKKNVRKCSFQSKLKNQSREAYHSTHTNLKILQWNAGGLSQSKKTELHLHLVKHDVDFFAIIEATLAAEKLIYYQLNGYTLHSLPKYRQIASGIFLLREDLWIFWTLLKFSKRKFLLEIEPFLVKHNRRSFYLANRHTTSFPLHISLANYS